jgi:putative membrane protein
MATRVLITGIAVFLAIAIVPGIGVESLTAGVAAVLVLTVLNLLARPMLYVLSFPFIDFGLLSEARS